ncbi:MAG: hypothetical protein ABIJ61_10665 [bacterium]
MRILTDYLSILAVLLLIGCSSGPAPVAELRHFPVDDMSGVLALSNVELDSVESTDGGGSLRISVSGPAVIELFTVEDLDIENVMLIYQAHLRTESVDGQVYLEMWCDFEGLGAFFSRGLQSPLTGDNEWSTASTPFMLKEGQRPQRVRLNLVIDGSGTAWIDDIRLLTSSLS